jgi:hypothetical protein
MNLRAQIQNFEQQLGHYDATDFMSTDMNKPYLGLVKAAQEQLGDDHPALDNLPEIEPDMAIQAGVMRVALGQIYIALPSEGSASAGGTITGDLARKEF